MKKQKIANYLKTGILFVSVSLLLWSCEKETNNETYQPQSIIEKYNSLLKKKIL